MTVRELSLQIKKLFREEKEVFFSENALIQAVFEKNGLDRNVRILSPELLLPSSVSQAILEDTGLLLKGYPIQYYRGTELFCEEEYFVSPEVLIPRPETELLVHFAAEMAPKSSSVWDLCCGSGCVGLALLNLRPDVEVTAFDISPSAIKLSEKNQKKLGRNSYRVFLEDVFSNSFLDRLKKEKPSLIVANPPYLTKGECDLVPENVKYEPSLALLGGEDGLMFYRLFAQYCAEFRVPFLCEIGAEQEKSVADIFQDAGISCEVYKDFSLLPRVLAAGKQFL